MANKVPGSVRPEIEDACRMAELDIKMHTNKVAKQCLGTLMQQQQQNYN